MLVAVAGASGRVGRRLIAYLKEHRIPHLALVRTEKSAKSLPEGTKFKIVDLESGIGLDEALKKATHIVNLSGSTDTTLSEGELYKANVLPLRHLLSCAPKTIKRFVHVSSISVYGKSLHERINEHSQRNGDTPYARAKLAAENFALDASAHLPVVVLQPGMIYGKEFEAGFFPMLKKISQGRMKIIGDGANQIPLIHVNDVVFAIHRSLEAQVRPGSVYLICPQRGITQLEAYALAAKALGVPAPQEKVSIQMARLGAKVSQELARALGKKPSVTPEMIEQLCSDRRYDTARAHKELGFAPRIGFKIGIAEVVKQFKKQNKE